MTGEEILTCSIACPGWRGSRVMAEAEMIYLEFFFGNMYICLPVPVVIEYVVVTFYQVNIKVGEVVAPFTEHVELFIFAAMEEVADNDELAGLKELNLVEQALKVFAIYFLRN